MVLLAGACSVVAAVAFAALPVWSALSDVFDPAHPWLFVVGAAAFASNLISALSRTTRVLAALAQAVCVFEMLGFSVAVTAGSYSASTRWPVMTAWEWAGTWGLFVVCLVALISAPLIQRASRPAST